jgi:hypothetical protein
MEPSTLSTPLPRPAAPAFAIAGFDAPRVGTAPFSAQPAVPQFTSETTVHEMTWWIPLFLFLTGWLTYFFRESNTAFFIGTACSTVAVARAVYLQLFRCKDFRFTWMIGCGQLLGYGLGSFNTAFGLLKQHETVASHFFRPQDDLSTAFTIVMWACAVLFLVGGILEKPVRLNLPRLMRSDISYVYLALMVYVLALATHQSGYMGTSVSDAGHVTVLGTIAGLVSGTIPAMTILLRKQSRLLSRAPIFWGLLLIEMVSLLPSGRRMIIYAMLTVLWSFSLTGAAWKTPLSKKALILVVCGAGFYGANVVFYSMRHVVNVSGAGKRMGAPDLSLSEIVSGAVKYIKQGRDSEFDEAMATNLRDRTFVLCYFSDLLAGAKTHEPLHGGILKFAVQMATPSSIYSLFGSKDEVIGLGMEENVANPVFGLKAQDEANSYLTGGVSDFGIYGVFLYPVALAFLINLCVRFGMGHAPEVMRCLVLLMMISSLFQTEWAVTGMIVFIRNIAILVIVWIPLSTVIRFFMRTHRRVPQPLHRRSAFAGATLVRYQTAPEHQIAGRAR